MNTKRFNCFIDTLPVAQGRPRFARRGKFVNTYDPKKSKDYKKLVAFEVRRFMQEGKVPVFSGAISLRLSFYFPRIKGKYGIYKETRPDCSNLAKGVEDALNGILWEDDSRIVVLSMEKRYTDEKEMRTGVLIEVMEVCNEIPINMQGILRRKAVLDFDQLT